MEDLKHRLKKVLAARQKIVMAEEGRAPAAVLVPLFCKDGELYILFTRRTETVRHHKGEISFPGGVFQPEDGNMAQTALRETAEEIGLAAGDIELIGELDDVSTMRSSFIISPFAGFIKYPCRFRLNKDEAAEIIEIPASFLMNGSCLRQETEIINGCEVMNNLYHFEKVVVHGATARILKQLLDIVARLPGAKDCR